MEAVDFLEKVGLAASKMKNLVVFRNEMLSMELFMMELLVSLFKKDDQFCYAGLEM